MDIANIVIDLGKAIGRGFSRDFVSIWSGSGELLSWVGMALIISKISS